MGKLDDILAHLEESGKTSERLAKSRDIFRSQFGVGPEVNEELGIKPGEKIDPFIDPFGLFENPKYQEFLPVHKKRQEIDKLFDSIVANSVLEDATAGQEVKDMSNLLGGKDGVVRGKDLNPFARSIADSLGDLIPKVKGPVHDLDILGPHQGAFTGTPNTPSGNIDPRTRSIFQTLGLDSGEGSLPAEISDPGSLTPFGQDLADKTGSVQGLDAELLAREFDKGLQAPIDVIGQEDDLEAPLGTDEILQIGKAVDTRLRTPHSSQEIITAQQQQKLIASAVIAGGGTVEQAQQMMSLFNEDMPASQFNQALTQVGTGVRTTFKEQEEMRQIQMRESQKQARLNQTLDRRDQLANANNQFKHGSAVVIAEMEQQHQLNRDSTQFGRAVALEEQKSANRLNNKIEAIKTQQVFTKEQQELKRSAQVADALFKRETAFELEHLKHLNRVARDTAKEGQSTESAMADFYRDLARKDPQLAQIIIDQMSQAPDGVDPMTSRAVVEGIRERVNDYILSSSLQEDLMDIQANKFKKYPDSADKLDAMDALRFKYPLTDFPAAKEMIDTAKQQVIDNTAALGKAKGPLSTTNVMLGSPGEREDLRIARQNINKIRSIRALFNPSLTGEAQGHPVSRALRQWANGILPFASLSQSDQEFLASVQEMSAKQRNDLLGVAMNANEIRITHGAFPALDMSDDQFLASLNVMERNQLDIADYIEADISRDEDLKEHIKNRIVDRARYVELKFKGTEEDRSKFVKDAVGRLSSKGFSRRDTEQYLRDIGVEF